MPAGNRVTITNTDALRVPATPEQVKRARETYAMGSDCDIEIDGNAVLSEAEEGDWISAWLWLPHETMEEEETTT